MINREMNFSVWITTDECGYFALIRLHWRQFASNEYQSIHAAK